MNQTDEQGNVSGGIVLPAIAQIPAGWTFGALTIGLGGGLALAFAAPAAMPHVLAVAGPVGELWLRRAIPPALAVRTVWNTPVKISAATSGTIVA